MRDVCDFVIWSPRAYNCVADCLANIAMDIEEDREFIDRALLTNIASLRLCVDGGRRQDTSGGLGIAIYNVSSEATGGGSTYTLIGQRSIFLKSVSSAFVVEALTLESGLEFLVSIIEGTIS